jgi:hypothetical protein
VSNFGVPGYPLRPGLSEGVYEPCGICGAVVPSADRGTHAEWHCRAAAGTLRSAAAILRETATRKTMIVRIIARVLELRADALDRAAR